MEDAYAAVAAWETFINDVLVLVRSPGLADLASRHKCALVVMHNQDGTDYAGDLMAEVKRFLRASVAAATAAGVRRAHILVDPGTGFGKTANQNWEVMRRLAELREREP